MGMGVGNLGFRGICESLFSLLPACQFRRFTMQPGVGEGQRASFGFKQVLPLPGFLLEPWAASWWTLIPFHKAVSYS